MIFELYIRMKEILNGLIQIQNILTMCQMLINSKSDGITYMHHSLFQAIQLKPILILHCTLELEKQARHGLVHLKQKLET